MLQKLERVAVKTWQGKNEGFCQTFYHWIVVFSDGSNKQSNDIFEKCMHDVRRFMKELYILVVLQIFHLSLFHVYYNIKTVVMDGERNY